jgi:hypothetical protein
MSDATPRPRRDAPGDERPPFFGSWNRLYAAVLAYLAALIALFYIITRVYS